MREIVNRKAKFEYQFLDVYEAGIQLYGAEVKSIRAGNANLSDAYCYFKNNELWLKSMFVAEYGMATDRIIETRRERKLLLKKGELKKLEKKVKERGVTIVPYRLYINDRGFVKIEIATARGKKIHDKRNSIKERDLKRDLDRLKKY